MSEIPLAVFIRKEPHLHPHRENLVLSVEEAMKKLNEDGLVLAVSKGYWMISDSKFENREICKIKIGDNRAVSLERPGYSVFYHIGVYDPTNNNHLQKMVNSLAYQVEVDMLRAEAVLDG